MKAALLGVKCITNLHIGTSGNAYGNIKIEVEKDAVLSTPIIPSSGIKGALREFWRENDTEESTVTIFGSDADKEKQNKKGNCKFVSGQLLLRPMRVSKGDYAYCLVTTSELLQVMIDTVELFQIKLNTKYKADVEDLKKGLDETRKELNQFKEQTVVGMVIGDNSSISEVEGYEIKTQSQKNALHNMLLKISDGIPVVIIRTEFFQMIDLPIIARNHLKDGKSSNLWYEEFVPHQSYFYFPVLWEKEETEVFSDFIRKICKHPIAFGGNNSVGYGYCTITPMHQGEVENDGK